ncbi:MAG: YqgE/AlgH family protein [Rubripirellula sp.]
MNHNLTGRLLIASPYLSDGHFMRSVVFIVRHELDGAFGLSINRPIEKRFRDLLHEAVDSAKVRDDDQIFIGGPVPGPIMALHNLAGIGDPCNCPSDNQDGEDELKPGETITQGVKHTVHDCPADPWGSMSIDLGNPQAWITSDEDHLRLLLSRTDAHVRYFKDYSGWGPGQLDEELKVGGWLVGDATEEILFGSPHDAWEIAVKQCGHKILNDITPNAGSIDPNLN